MRRVAGDASFCFHGRMFKDKWTRLFRVAGEADLVLRRGGTQLPGQETTMRVVAIRACQQAFIDAMVNRSGELRFYFSVAPVTEHRLGRHQQCAFHCGMMRRVAVNAAYVVLQVLRSQEVRVFFTELMAAQAAFARFLARQRAEPDDLRDIAAALNVRLAGSVTCLAPLILDTTMVKQSLPMRAVIVGFRDLIVAGTARVGACIQRWIGWITGKRLALGRV